MQTLRLIYESFLFALGALRENLLRTTLSLLGVTVGIFAIIGVRTMVDSLNNSITNSISFLSSDVIYVEKWPWIFAENYPWWKYVNRPTPNPKEFQFLKENMSKAAAISIFARRGNMTIKYKSNSISSVFVFGTSHQYDLISDVRIEQGRYFSVQEADNGRNVVLIGANIAEDLFQGMNPIGQSIRIRNMQFVVIGVMKRQGENLLGTPSNDNICIIPFYSLAKMFSTGGRRGLNPIIAVKGYPNDPDLSEAEAEVKGLLRSYRGLLPMQEDSFAINRPEVIAGFFNNIIRILTIAGTIIGSFSILVGGFGIANIMFVSVKERTNLIGIQKSLGAKNYFILFQFLFEAILLSLSGGIAGLMLVSLLGLISTDTFEVELSLKNVIWGVSLASIIGILSGIIPAIVASRLDPVEAIRSK